MSTFNNFADTLAQGKVELVNFSLKHADFSRGLKCQHHSLPSPLPGPLLVTFIVPVISGKKYGQ